MRNQTSEIHEFPFNKIENNKYQAGRIYKCGMDSNP